MNELEIHLNKLPTSLDSFTVNSDSSANWALRKISQLNSQINDNDALAQAEFDKIEQWNTDVNSTINNSIDYFQSLLAQYAAEKRKEDPKFKSSKLPNGSFGFRKSQPKWSYDNEKVVQALENASLNDFIRVTKVPNKKDIKRVFEVSGGQVINPDSGEILEGITVEDQPDNFSVKAE